MTSSGTMQTLFFPRMMRPYPIVLLHPTALSEWRPVTRQRRSWFMAVSSQTNTCTTMSTIPSPAPDQAYIDVSALEAGIINLSIDRFLADTEPEIVSCPSLAFLLRHSKTGFQIVFDLGTRRDFEGYPPATQKRIQSLGFLPTVKQDVAESLEKGGVAPDEVDAVIVSHLHWDQ